LAPAYLQLVNLPPPPQQEGQRDNAVLLLPRTSSASAANLGFLYTPFQSVGMFTSQRNAPKTATSSRSPSGGLVGKPWEAPRTSISPNQGQS
ncbi:unnamed protein product, partial [Penicillium manginii]